MASTAHSSSNHSDSSDLPPLRYSPLNSAAFTGDLSKVEQRLVAGDHVDALCRECIDGVVCVMTPLYLAAGKGHGGVVRVLLHAGANPSAVNPGDGSSVLYAAALDGNMEVITMLLRAGAVVDWTDHKSRTALFGAAFAGKVNVVQALLSANATVDMANNYAYTPLMVAAMHRYERCVRTLLWGGADLSKTEDSKGLTALHGAAFAGRDEVVRTLLSCGAGVNSPHLLGMTALFAAANQSRTQTVKLLLDAGADPQIRDRDKATVLMYAAGLPTVKVLLEAGVSAAAVDVYGNTALHCAGKWGRSKDLICAICAAGANPTLLNRAGETAAQLALEKGHNDAAALLDMFATEYAHAEKSVAEAKDEPSTAVPSVDVSELEAKMKAACVSDISSDKVAVGSAKSSQAIEKEQKQKVLRPCLNCQTLTHRRCARCRTAYICSRDCQVATLAEHRVECMEIYEEREKAIAKRDVAGSKEESC